MKKKVLAIVLLIFILSVNSLCYAQEEIQSYMELSTVGAWNIFTKDMDNQELLSAVGKSAEEINEILKSTGSESVIINKDSGTHVFLKVKKNDASYDLWNISDFDEVYIMENLKTIIYDAFLMESFNYQDENVKIKDYAYMKFITVPGNAYINGTVHGVICGGTIVNGSAIVFTMITEEYIPTQEDIDALDDIAKGVSFTVIKDKTEKAQTGDVQNENEVFHYILGGFAALVVMIFCVYMIARIKNNDSSQNKEE